MADTLVGTSTKPASKTGSGDVYCDAVLKVWRVDNGSTTIPDSDTYRYQVYWKARFNEKRYQHRWKMEYKLDGTKLSGGSSTNTTLPDSNAGNVNPGYINLVKGTEYRWGPGGTVSIKNDGKSHTITFSGGALNSVRPGQFPLTSSICSVSFTARTKPITPSSPTVYTSSLNETTRRYTYKWNAATNAVKYALKRTWYDEAGNVDSRVSPTAFFTVNNKTTFTFDEVNKGVLVEQIPDDIWYVKYTVYTYSSTNTSKASAVQTSSQFPLTRKVWVKVGTTWRKAVPWVKVNGVWKKCKKTYVKVGNTWKLTKF